MILMAIPSSFGIPIATRSCQVARRRKDRYGAGPGTKRLRRPTTLPVSLHVKKLKFSDTGKLVSQKPRNRPFQRASRGEVFGQGAFLGGLTFLTIGGVTPTAAVSATGSGRSAAT
jgi:hypothetical protein